MGHVRSTLIATLLLAAPLGTGAQGLGDVAAAAMPQYVSVKIGSGATAKTVTQLTVPVVVVVPISSRLNFDVATAFATSDVSTNGVIASLISGLTDTQVRTNLTLGTDAVVFTVGANLPTGQYEITPDKADAAGQIGNDFLMFPTSSYGAGLSTTGGIAVARSLGNWNFGVAGSFRKSTKFNAFERQDKAGTETLTFTPADEVRTRIGADRMIGNGRLMLGFTFSTFGDDVLANTSYATGDRYIGQASLLLPVGKTDVFLSGWGLYRAKGQQFGGESAPENVLNGALALGFRLGNLYLEPNVEVRNWQVDGYQAGFLGNGGVRLRWTAGAFSVIPTAIYQMGQLNPGSSEAIDLAGWRASVTLRIH